MRKIDSLTGYCKFVIITARKDFVILIESKALSELLILYKHNVRAVSTGVQAVEDQRAVTTRTRNL